MTHGPRTGIDLLERQLWGSAVGNGLARVVTSAHHPEAGSGWQVEETYWAVPSLQRMRLLVPAAGRLATSASLWNYRNLREPRERWVRTLLGGWARAGGRPGRHLVSLQVRSDAVDEARAALPLSSVARALGHDRLFASIGVRPGANGKPTLQLINHQGHPVGYAKLGWNQVSDRYVRSEAQALHDLEGGSPTLGVPRLLASGSLGGHPWLVSAPLPGGSRALAPGAEVVSADWLTSVCPIVRSAPVAQTGQWQRLTARLAAHDPSAPSTKALRGLVEAVSQRDTEMPVSQRWHGDLTPWNCARDDGGRLWCWDWENTEDDVVAGLDALHWAFSVRRRTTAISAVSLADCVEDVAAALGDLCVPRSARGVLAGTYAAVVADRALGLAEVAGWERSWISEPEVIGVIDQGLDQVCQDS